MSLEIKYLETGEALENYFTPYKGVFRMPTGNILVVGGSYLHHSPMAVAGYSLSNLGCNEVTLIVPSKHLYTIASKLVAIEVFPLPDQKITKGGVNKILKYLDKGRIRPHSGYVGAGVTGIWKEVGILVYRLAKEYNIPLVLDRDAVRPQVLQHVDRDLEIILMIDNAVLSRILESRTSDIVDDIRMILNSYSNRIIYVGDGYIASYSEDENSLIGLKFEMPLKKYERYVLASLASSLLAKGVPSKYASILAPALYLEARDHMIKALGALYSLEDTVLYLREYLTEL